MLPVLTPDQMRALERRHLDTSGEPSLALMERAAKVFTDALEEKLHGLSGRRVIVACGPGNNGGDGYAVARMAIERGALAGILPLCPEEDLSGDALLSARAADGVPRAGVWEYDDLDAPDIWVDAAFGIGLSRPVGPEYLALFERMASDRAGGSFIASIDLPSGLDGRSGRPLGGCVSADLTVTFECMKPGHLLIDGPDMCGSIEIRPIGISHDLLPEDHIRLVEPADIAGMFPPRRRNTHKGDYGHLLIIAGSRGMAGAALFSAAAALKTGAGLVTVACPSSIVDIIQTSLPAAMCLPLSEGGGAISERAVPALKAALEGKNALVIGPGLSRGCDPAVVELALSSHLPAVVDADALNIISEHPGHRRALAPRHVLTPHPGEAKRLTGEPISDMLKAADELRALGPAVLLKGQSSVIRAKHLYISASGTPGMAKGGSGDVLAGIIGALLARGESPEAAAWAGSELHGLAGELAAAALTETSMCAPDIISQIPAAIRR